MTEFDYLDLPELIDALRNQMNTLCRPLIIVGVNELSVRGTHNLIQIASSDRLVCRSTLAGNARELFLQLCREWHFGAFQTDKPNVVFVVWENPAELNVFRADGVEYADFCYFGNIVFSDRERTIEQSIDYIDVLNNNY